MAGSILTGRHPTRLAKKRSAEAFDAAVVGSVPRMEPAAPVEELAINTEIASASDSTRNRSPLTKLATFAASNWQITLGIWAAVLALGGIAYAGGLAREGFPPVNIPIVVVDGTYFVDDPDQVDSDITVPLSDAYQEVDGVVEVQSFALDNAYAVIVEFDSTFSSPDGAEVLSAITPDIALPPEATADVRSIDATKFLEVYDVLVSISGPENATAAELEEQATLLEAYLSEQSSIEQAVVRNLITEGVNPATGEEEVRRTRFARVAFAETGRYEEAITIGVIREPSSDLDILGFSDEINGLLEDESVLADGYSAAVTADFATDIRSQISNLTGSLLTGLLAVALVSLLLIGWRVAIITAGFMATVILASLAGLWFLGYSLNTITLFGLILTLGLLVDDAIVISESLDANRKESKDPIGVVRAALNRVGSASLAGTITTVLVFAPMLFVSGVLGEFIRAIPATVILTLIGSFIFSVVFIPAIAKPFLLKGSTPDNPVIRAERSFASKLGALAAYPSRNGAKGILLGVGIALAAFGAIFGSFQIAATVGFNIFPPGDDANAMFVTVDFDPGTTIEEAQERSRQVDDIVIKTLGEDLVRSQYINANQRQMLTIVDLKPFSDRDTTAPEYVERLEAQLGDLDNMRITVAPLENGPPVADFPFAAQIAVDDDSVATAEQLAVELRDQLIGAELDKSSGETTTILDAIVSTEGQVFRSNGERQIEVRAAYSNDDLTNNLDATEVLVGDLFDGAELESRGLDADAIAFDFGQESDNQDDFAALGQALQIALILMVLLLIVQFRSFVQWLLILLAIPFSFFGVFTALSLTGNPISFFVAVGFIALIGVVVNNTILLVDAANQGRRDGLSPGGAIGQAVERRFRPLVATTITTVVGLLPLALSDPFWEALSFTLIGGLVSSTILVLLAFPVFYLGVETLRTKVRNAVRGRQGRPLV